MQLFHKIKIYKLTGKKFKARLPTTIVLCIKNQMLKVKIITYVASTT